MIQSLMPTPYVEPIPYVPKNAGTDKHPCDGCEHRFVRIPGECFSPYRLAECTLDEKYECMAVLPPKVFGNPGVTS